jgi:hypothetical protein
MTLQRLLIAAVSAYGLLRTATVGAQSAKLMIFGGEGHDVFLGCLNCSQYATDSVHNQYSDYGSPYASNSIFNHYGDYGSRYSDSSPCNPYAGDPPVIVDGGGSFYGRLTLNEYQGQANTNPDLLQWLRGAVCAN